MKGRKHGASASAASGRLHRQADDRKPEENLVVPQEGILEGDPVNASTFARDILASVVDEVVRRSKMAPADNDSTDNSEIGPLSRSIQSVPKCAPDCGLRPGSKPQTRRPGGRPYSSASGSSTYTSDGPLSSVDQQSLPDSPEEKQNNCDTETLTSSEPSESDTLSRSEASEQTQGARGDGATLPCCIAVKGGTCPHAVAPPPPEETSSDGSLSSESSLFSYIPCGTYCGSECPAKARPPPAMAVSRATQSMQCPSVHSLLPVAQCATKTLVSLPPPTSCAAETQTCPGVDFRPPPASCASKAVGCPSAENFFGGTAAQPYSDIPCNFGAAAAPCVDKALSACCFAEARCDVATEACSVAGPCDAATEPCGVASTQTRVGGPCDVATKPCCDTGGQGFFAINPSGAADSSGSDATPPVLLCAILPDCSAIPCAPMTQCGVAGPSECVAPPCTVLTDCAASPCAPTTRNCLGNNAFVKASHAHTTATAAAATAAASVAALAGSGNKRPSCRDRM